MKRNIPICYVCRGRVTSNQEYALDAGFDTGVAHVKCLPAEYVRNRRLETKVLPERAKGGIH